MIRAAIIEDEVYARERLIKLLDKYAERLDIIGTSDNGEDALRLLQTESPDLVFLDIQMPVFTGFEILKKLSYEPKIVFTTAYDNFALKAFEENSLDYLLKPISEERLALTMEKLKKWESNPSSINILELLQNIGEQKSEEKKDSISITRGDKIILMRLQDIYFLRADNKYVSISSKGQTNVIADLSLSGFEEKLNADFIRIHRSFIINKKWIRSIRKSFNGKFVFYMNDPSETQFTSGSTYRSKIALALNLLK